MNAICWYVCAEAVYEQAQFTWPEEISEMASKPWVYRHVFLEAQSGLIAEHCLQSQSYLKCQDVTISAFPKSQVPDQWTVFCLVARSREM